MKSQARTLDIIYCGSTPPNGRNPERAYYGFPVGPSNLLHADIYPESKFNLSSLEPGKRYIVTTAIMPCLAWSGKAQQFTYQDKFIWVKATEVQTLAPIAARTTKQRKASEAMAAFPIADNGDLFSW